MIMILSRHGNTFNSGDRVYRVGKRNDLPLTSIGEVQAEFLANQLIKKGIIPCAIYCGPLKRTVRYAQIVIEKMQLPLQLRIDERLNELDYGGWAGLTDAEINEKYPDDLRLWVDESLWPAGSKWPETEASVIAAVADFERELSAKYEGDEVVLVVSSAGKLKYFLRLLGDAVQCQQKGGTSVKTGNICKLSCSDKKCKIDLWNASPAEL